MGPLETSKLCRAFEPEEIMAFEALARRRLVADGELVLELDHPNGSVFVVEQGAVSVERPGPGGALTIAELGPGETFGEMSFLDHGPATARVRARGPAVLVELSHEMLEELLEDNTRLWGKVWRNVALVLKERLVRANELLERHVDESRLDPQEDDLAQGPGRGV
jgi:CRP-like cAMP-binding protein